MDRQTALSIYTQALLEEREGYLYQRALKAHAAPGGTEPGDKDSRAFANELYHIKRRDKIYQALTRGELIMDYHAAEFEQLSPLIIEEIRHGNEVSLPFLRSVARGRVSLAKAHAAIRQLKLNAPQKILREQGAILADEAERRLERHLLRGDLKPLVKKNGNAKKIVSQVVDGAFSRGVSTELIEEAFAPQSLSKALQGAVVRGCPELAVCGSICLESGEKVSTVVREAAQRAKSEVCATVRERFYTERIRRLVSKNPSLKRLQRQADAAQAREKRLKSALLGAVPEHYRDLYPLARKMRRRFILHLGPTNSGKTYEGVGRLRGARHGIYLGPLRLLAAEQFDALNRADVPCSLVTGEEQIRVPGSRVQSSTVEMADLRDHYDVAVIDECQMISDRDRGGAWTAAILGLCADEIHACASPDAEALLTRIIEECGDEVSIVRHQRKTPLMVERAAFEFPASVRPGDALIVFAKARVHAVAAELKRKGFRVSLIYGALPPDVRRDQADRFLQGDTDVVVSTDAIAMGMNLPIERVVFLESEKYDGDITRPLTDAEIKQIAGRAGRYGQYDVGYVNAYGFKGVVARALGKPLPPLTEAVIGFPESLIGDRKSTCLNSSHIATSRMPSSA